MATDPRVEVITELRKQTALLTLIQSNLTAMAGTLLDMADSHVRPAMPAAPSVDLDGKHGNPIVKAKDPRDWSGETMRGRRFSECPPAYLDMLAERFDYFASREEDATKQKYNLLDAQRALGWAARLRAGYVAPEPAQTTGGDW
jgi:hypothetical protein